MGPNVPSAWRTPGGWQGVEGNPLAAVRKLHRAWEKEDGDKSRTGTCVDNSVFAPWTLNMVLYENMDSTTEQSSVPLDGILR